MADKVEMKADPPKPPETPLPEAVVQPPAGDTTRVTVDTTKPLPKAPDAAPERPKWLPEEFKTPEELVEAYKKATPTEPALKVEEAVTKAGLDMAALSDEFAKGGKLSDESMAKLEKAGITKTQVDGYIEGQKAVVSAYQQKLAESVGGAEELQATLKWAGTLTQPEIDAANVALASGNAESAKLVLAGLHSRRLQAEGIEPSLVGGRGVSVNAGPGAYESSAQLIKDMQSKEYKTDPAFRSKVEARLKLTKM